MSQSLSLRQILGLIGSGLAASAILVWTGPARAQEEREIIIQKVLVAEKEGAEDDDDDDKPAKANYWIGIGGGIVDNGLRIENVFPDSPAAKAGLKSGDVVAAVGDKKIEKIEQLVDLVQDSRGRELKLKVLRDGKELGIVVKPGQRPKELVIEEREEREGKEEKKEPNRYQPKLGQPGAPAPGTPLPGSSARPGANPGTPAAGERRTRVQAVPMTPGTPASGGFSFGAPGAPAAGTAPRQPAIAWMSMNPSSAQLPDDMQVTVSKKGNKPAVVTATQGDKLWKTTENELGMLPQPAQAYASRLLGKDVLRARTMGGAPGMMPGMGMPGMGGGVGMPGMGAGAMVVPGAGGERMELRLGEGGRVEAIQGTGARPNVKVLPGGGIQVEIREEGEKKEKPEASENDLRARRIKSLQDQADRLRGLLEKLREEVKEKK